MDTIAVEPVAPAKVIGPVPAAPVTARSSVPADTVTPPVKLLPQKLPLKKK
jgi:hypothetical protein